MISLYYFLQNLALTFGAVVASIHRIAEKVIGSSILFLLQADQVLDRPREPGGIYLETSQPSIAPVTEQRPDLPRFVAICEPKLTLASLAVRI